MKTIFNKIIAITTLMTLSVSCVNETFNDPIQADCVNPSLVKTKEVSDVYAVAINPVAIAPSTIPNTPEYTSDDVIEAYVISNDKGGNFFKNMYFQPIDGSRGFIMSVDDDNIYNEGFEPGRKVYLKMKGLHFGNPSDFTRGLVFGAQPTDIYDVDRIPTLEYKKYLIPSCQIVDEETIVHKLTLSQAQSDTYLNTLVEIEDVQFDDVAVTGTYSKPDFDTSLKLTNGSATLDVRTSKFAKFAGNPVAKGRGKIRGVLGKYNNGYQLILRTENDVKFDNPRVLSPTLPLGGTNITFSGTLNEPFTSYATNINSFSNYINDRSLSTKYWLIKEFSSNKYLEMSSFAGTGNPGTPAKCYFIVPVDFTAANSLTFSEKIRFNNGNALNVYYVKQQDFTVGFLNVAPFVNITSSFNITYPGTNSSESNFNSAGTYNIPTSLTGNGYFVFEYVGTTTITTTVQLDDIVIN
jgi:hypothetical protein